MSGFASSLFFIMILVVCTIMAIWGYLLTGSSDMGDFSQISSCYLFMIAQISNRFVIISKCYLANSSVCQLVPFLMYI